MNYHDEIFRLAGNAEAMEALYKAAQASGDAAAFTDGLHACYQEMPENLLLAAWHYRLQTTPPAERTAHPDRSLVWRWAVPFALASSLILGLVAVLSEDAERVPLFFLVWSPIAAALAIAFLVSGLRIESEK